MLIGVACVAVPNNSFKYLLAMTAYAVSLTSMSRLILIMINTVYNNKCLLQKSFIVSNICCFFYGILMFSL